MSAPADESGLPPPPPGYLWQSVCSGSELQEAGDAVGFDLTERVGAGQSRWVERGFVIRHGGQVHGFVNRCAHVPVELDWQPGKVFDPDRVLLMCALHGATYHPQTGRCMGGPCRGRGLEPVTVREHDAQVWAAVPLPEAPSAR